MTTPFALLLALSGLSYAEAAAYLGVRKDTIRSWATGRRGAHPEKVVRLRELIERQEATATDMVVKNECPCRRDFETTDHEAERLGWPCASAYHMMVARVIARRGVE